MSKKDGDNVQVEYAENQLKKKLIEDGVTDPAHLAIMTDQYSGRGGSYLYDPQTGLRTPIE